FLRSGLIGKPPDSGSGDWRFESSLLSSRRSHRLAARTPASHVGSGGSIPPGTIRILRSRRSGRIRRTRKCPGLRRNLTVQGLRGKLAHALRVGATRERPNARLRWLWESGAAQRSETMSSPEGVILPTLHGIEGMGPVISPRAQSLPSRHTACFVRTSERPCTVLGGPARASYDAALTLAGGKAGRAGP